MDKKKQILITVLVGLFGSAVFILLPLSINGLIVSQFWSLVISYNVSFQEIPIFQNALIVILGSFIVGTIVCSQLGSLSGNVENMMRRAGLSGAISGFLLIGAYFYSVWSFSIVNFPGAFGIPQSGLPGSGNSWIEIIPFISFLLLDCVIILVISIGIQILGAYFWHSLQTNGGKPIFSLKNPMLSKLLSKYSIIVLSILMVLIIIVPAQIIYTEMRMDLIEPSSPYYDCCYHYPNQPFVSRYSPDSIYIAIAFRDERVDYGKKNPFKDSAPGL